MFDPDFYMDMLTDMGYPKALAEVQRDMYVRLVRRIKVAVSFGDELAPTCGMGHGCSLTLISANATVTIEFSMLDNIAPSIYNGAFLDDRSLDCQTVAELKRGIEAIVEMDAIMGHTTNIDKSKFLAAAEKVRMTMKTIQMNGILTE